MTNVVPGTLDAQVCFRAVSELILEVIEGPDAGKRVVVDKPIVVGRDPGAGFVLQDREVSRRHLQLTPTGDYVTVEDLGSANGTFVNHNELHGPARLDAGDELLAGVTVMQLRDRQQVEARHSAVIAVPQGLATAPRTPAYADPQKVTADLHAEQGSIPELEKFLDVRVRRRAVNAPWLLAVLVALVRRGLLPHQDHPFGDRGRADRRLDLRGGQHPDAEQERRRGDPVHRHRLSDGRAGEALSDRRLRDAARPAPAQLGRDDRR